MRKEVLLYILVLLCYLTVCSSENENRDNVDDGSKDLDEAEVNGEGGLSQKRGQTNVTATWTQRRQRRRKAKLEERKAKRKERRKERRRQNTDVRQRVVHGSDTERPRIRYIWKALVTMQKEIEGLQRHLEEEPVLSPWECDPMLDHDSSCRKSLNSTIICEGRGQCICGVCLCVQPYYGLFCECSDRLCDYYLGEPCGGTKRGKCVCGKCACETGYRGDNCREQKEDTKEGPLGCENPQGKTGIQCSNAGTCVDGECLCRLGYGGDYCQYRAKPRNKENEKESLCERLEACVACEVLHMDGDECNCHMNVTLVDQIDSDGLACVTEAMGCALTFSPINISKDPLRKDVLVQRDNLCKHMKG